MSFARSRLSPELIAAVLCLIVLGVVLVRPSARASAQPAATPGPSEAPGPAGSGGLSASLRSSLSVVITVNGRLTDSAKELSAELARTPRRINQISVILPRISSDVASVTAVGGAVRTLTSDPATATLGIQLDDAYGALAETTRGVSDQSVRNETAYVKAATGAVAQITALAPLTARAQRILDGEVTSPAPSVGTTPSGSAVASGPPSLAPTATPAPSPTPLPSAAPPTEPPASGPVPSLAPGGLLVNGGFEKGLTGWVVRTNAPAAGTVSEDRTQHVEGAASARIDIQADSGARSGVSLAQGGIAIQAGQSYVIQLSIKAAVARDVRIRVTDATETAPYIARIVDVTPAWTTITIQFDSIVDDPTAEILIDVGQSTASVWVDAVALAPAPS